MRILSSFQVRLLCSSFVVLSDRNRLVSVSSHYTPPYHAARTGFFGCALTQLLEITRALSVDKPYLPPEDKVRRDVTIRESSPLLKTNKQTNKTP